MLDHFPEHKDIGHRILYPRRHMALGTAEARLDVADPIPYPYGQIRDNCSARFDEVVISPYSDMMLPTYFDLEAMLMTNTINAAAAHLPTIQDRSARGLRVFYAAMTSQFPQYVNRIRETLQAAVGATTREQEQGAALDRPRAEF